MSKQIKSSTLLRTKFALEHHAKPLKAVADALLYALAGSGLAYRFGSSRGGANSWYVYVMTDQGKKCFHLRSRQHPWRIDVKLNPYKDPVFASLHNERDVIRFVGSL